MLNNSNNIYSFQHKISNNSNNTITKYYYSTLTHIHTYIQTLPLTDYYTHLHGRMEDSSANIEI